MKTLFSQLVAEVIAEELAELVEEGDSPNSPRKPAAANPLHKNIQASKLGTSMEIPHGEHIPDYRPEMSTGMKKTQRAKQSAEIADKKMSAPPSEPIYGP